MSYLFLVIPKSRVLSSGARDLARSGLIFVMRKSQHGSAREIPHSAGEGAEFRDDGLEKMLGQRVGNQMRHGSVSSVGGVRLRQAKQIPFDCAQGRLSGLRAARSEWQSLKGSEDKV